MTISAKHIPHLLFLLFLSLALFAACGRPDGEDIGEEQSDREVDEFIEHPGNPLAGSGQASPVDVFPFYHGSLGMRYAGLDILIDPYDGAERYERFSAPDLVLITHTHPDHMDTKTLSGLDLSKATLVAPQAVMNGLSGLKFAEREMLANGDTLDYKGNLILAVPAYNVPPTNGHPKGQFNGYVLELGKERVYVSGDTGPAPELKELRNIDMAFVSMNEPYTMSIDSAASLVTAIRPKLVRPYHYRNKDGSFADLKEFRRLVQEDAPGVRVLIEDWYVEPDEKESK